MIQPCVAYINIRILGGGARVFLQHAYSYTVFAKTGKLKAGTHILGVSRGGFGGESSRNPPYTVHLYGKTLIRSKNLAGGGPGIFLLTDMPRSSYKTRGRSGIMLITAIFLHGIILISRLSHSLANRTFSRLGAATLAV
jgi:hypothetical protein